jgi:5-oxoprolinase (ATP-hydrolysing) subunit A
MTKIDLNSDMGEGFGVYSLGDDAAMLDVVTSANIACGFHAGDPLVMHKTLSDAHKKGVGAGAHPSFLDLWGFGRRPIHGERPSDVEKHIIYQIGAAQALAISAGTKLAHVKTHGSLGNMANEDDDLADAVARAIRVVDRDLIMVVMPGLATERAGARYGLKMAREIYADRAYAANGNLVPRTLPGAVIHDAAAAAARVLRMVERQAVETVDGVELKVQIDTICVHGDTPGAVDMARQVRGTLVTAGVELAPIATVLASR